MFKKIVFSQDKEEFDSDVPLRCMYVIHSAADGHWHATNLLSMLVDIFMEAAASFDATPAFQDYLAWILDSFVEVHELQVRWQGATTLGQPWEKVDFLSFCTVHTLLSTLRDSLSDSVLRKGYVILSLLFAALLRDRSTVFDKSIQLNLCSCLLSLVAVCENDHSMRRTVSLHLLPAVRATLADDKAFKTLGNDFQVYSPIHLV